MAGIIERLTDNKGNVRPLSAQDYANLTVKDREELQRILKDKGESLEEYEGRVRKLSPPKVTMPPIRWVGI